jgi:hypothetical protein
MPHIGQYAPSFVSNDISGPILLDLTLDDLDYMGVDTYIYINIINLFYMSI